jgi:histone-lysine N-methyltransferase SETD7
MRNKKQRSKTKNEESKSHSLDHLSKFGPIFTFEEATLECFSMFPLLPDPYEQDRIYVQDSRLPGAQEGMFAKRVIKSDEIVAWYSGHKLPIALVDRRKWDLNSNTISVSDDTCIDVPAPYDKTNVYCASSGHKANHAFFPNAKFELVFHPRFGLIKSVKTIRQIEKDEEILADYGYQQKEGPLWYRKLKNTFKI